MKLYKRFHSYVEGNSLNVCRRVTLQQKAVNLKGMPTGVAQWLRQSATSRAVPGSNPGGVGHRDFSRAYRQNHVPWGQLSL